MTNSPNQPRTVSVACLYAILAKLNEPNLGDRHFFEWLDCASIDYLKGANAELAALRTRLEEAEARERWIPVSERLPDNERRVLVHVELPGRTSFCTGANYSEYGCHIDDSDDNGSGVVAWRELPEPYTPSKEQDHE